MSRVPAVAPKAVVRLARDEVHLVDNRLCPKAGGGPFTGVMFERAVGGRILTEVPVLDGQVHGVARGWHDNGQLEVEESFVHGVSNGIRTRWFPNGQKRNTATIVNGQLDGPYQEWHENGQLALRMTLVAGKGQGPCEAWHADGRMKSRVELKDGEPVATEVASQQSASPN
ncbi:MAG: toxin-antitoxin system YwqK family antitoxin [Roseimicrobium sp.]